MVEIAKALTRGARVLALDEPTSSLSAREVERLFATVAELKRNGCAVLYVSHRMDELFRVCDSATVLRDGRHVETFPSLEGVSHDLLVNRMVGRDIEDVFDYRPSTQTEICAGSCRRWRVRDSQGQPLSPSRKARSSAYLD